MTAMVVSVSRRQLGIGVQVVVHDHSRRCRPLPMCDRQQRAQRCFLVLHKFDGDVLRWILTGQLRDFGDVGLGPSAPFIFPDRS